MSGELPREELVWAVCPYVRQTFEGCRRCPRWRFDEDGDKVQRGCFAIAAEAVNIVQTGNPWRKGEKLPKRDRAAYMRAYRAANPKGKK